MKVTPRAFINHLQEGMLGRRRLLRVTFSCPAEPRSPPALHSTTPPVKLLLEDRTQLDHAHPGDLSTAGLGLCRHLRGQGQDVLSVFPAFHRAAHPKAVAGSSAEVSFKPESTQEAGCQRTEVEGRCSSPESLHI